MFKLIILFLFCLTCQFFYQNHLIKFCLDNSYVLLKNFLYIFFIWHDSTSYLQVQKILEIIIINEMYRKIKREEMF